MKAKPHPLDARRVAVTGATGFIGTHLVDHLRAAGAHVTAIVARARASSRDGHTDADATIFFDTPADLPVAVCAAAPEFVVHLHAAVSSARSATAIPEMVEHNLLPSIALMSAALDMNLQRLILIGSGEEFGPRTGLFNDETAPNPVSPYGASKAAVTAFARMYANAFALPVTVLRPSVVYGPGQAPRMLIPQVMQALREGREVPTTAGEQTRDFIHVDDLARGILAALTAPASGKIDGRAWNLGTGEIVTVRDTLARIERLTGTSGLIRYGALPYRTGELFRYEPEVASTFEALLWCPTLTLDEGLRQTWASFR